MSHHDEHLKDIIRADKPPQLPPAFADQTVRRLHLPVHKVQHLNGKTLALNVGMQRYKWWLMSIGLLISALALHQQHQAAMDEDLMYIDTLSMSSFSVL